MRARSHRSPGYAITLVASSTSHVIHSAEMTSCPPSTFSASASATAGAPATDASNPDAAAASSAPARFTPPVPEDLGLLAARMLLEEIKRGGCVDRGWEWLVSTMLVLGAEDVGRVKVAGPFDASLCVLFAALSSVNPSFVLTLLCTCQY